MSVWLGGNTANHKSGRGIYMFVEMGRCIISNPVLRSYSKCSILWFSSASAPSNLPFLHNCCPLMQILFFPPKFPHFSFKGFLLSYYGGAGEAGKPFWGVYLWVWEHHFPLLLQTLVVEFLMCSMIAWGRKRGVARAEDRGWMGLCVIAIRGLLGVDNEGRKKKTGNPKSHFKIQLLWMVNTEDWCVEGNVMYVCTFGWQKGHACVFHRGGVFPRMQHAWAHIVIVRLLDGSSYVYVCWIWCVYMCVGESLLPFLYMLAYEGARLYVCVYITAVADLCMMVAVQLDVHMLHAWMQETHASWVRACCRLLRCTCCFYV